jgi:hypothetical protein
MRYDDCTRKATKMSDATESTETIVEPADKKREPKKNSIPSDEIKALVKDLPSYTKTSFLVVGHKNGVRLAIPLTTGVSRVYFYANDDYSVIPDDEAIVVFDEADRKQHRRGGIMAEVDFEKGLEAARRALGKLVDAVKAAPAPAEKPKREPKPKKEAKAEEALPAEPEAAEAEAQA